MKNAPGKPGRSNLKYRLPPLKSDEIDDELLEELDEELEEIEELMLELIDELTDELRLDDMLEESDFDSELSEERDAGDGLNRLLMRESDTDELPEILDEYEAEMLLDGEMLPLDNDLAIEDDNDLEIEDETSCCNVLLSYNDAGVESGSSMLLAADTDWDEYAGVPILKKTPPSLNPARMSSGTVNANFSTAEVAPLNVPMFSIPPTSLSL